MRLQLELLHLCVSFELSCPLAKTPREHGRSHTHLAMVHRGVIAKDDQHASLDSGLALRTSYLNIYLAQNLHFFRVL